jgi:hypothetical protein
LSDGPSVKIDDALFRGQVHPNKVEWRDRAIHDAVQLLQELSNGFFENHLGRFGAGYRMSKRSGLSHRNQRRRLQAVFKAQEAEAPLQLLFHIISSRQVKTRVSTRRGAQEALNVVLHARTALGYTRLFPARPLSAADSSSRDPGLYCLVGTGTGSADQISSA